jgi:hypothetical protein
LVTSIQEDKRVIFWMLLVRNNSEKSLAAGVRHRLEDTQTFLRPHMSAVVLGASVSGYEMLNASRTAANDFDAQYCSRMNTSFTRVYTVLAPAQSLRNWREQRPSRKDDFVLRVTEDSGIVYYKGVNLLLIWFLCRSTWQLLGCVLTGTLRNKHVSARLYRHTEVCELNSRQISLAEVWPVRGYLPFTVLYLSLRTSQGFNEAN